MSYARATPHDDEPDAEGSAARAPAWAREHLDVLRDLRDMGMTLARTLTRQVVAQAEADEARADAGEVADTPRRGAPVDPALSFSRISRAVRLTLALEASTHRAIEAAAKAGAANDDAPARDDLTTPDGHIDYAAVRRRLHSAIHGETDYETRRAVEETIETSTDDPDEVARLKGELKERLEEEDPDEIFFIRTHWPIGEAIALIVSEAQPPFGSGLGAQAAAFAAFHAQGVSSAKRLCRWPFTRRVRTSVR
jgi:hypothetical protein